MGLDYTLDLKGGKEDFCTSILINKPKILYIKWKMISFNVKILYEDKQFDSTSGVLNEPNYSIL